MNRFFQFLLQPFHLLPCLGSQFRTGRAPVTGEEHNFHPLGHLFLLSTHAIPVGPKLLFQYCASVATFQPVLSETPMLHTVSATVLSHHAKQRSSPRAWLCCGWWCQTPEHSTVPHQLYAVALNNGDLRQKQEGSQAWTVWSTDLDSPARKTRVIHEGYTPV